MALFNDGNQSVEQEAKPEQENTVDQLLDSIKNEHGERKFKQVDDVFNGYIKSQEYIESLKAKQAELEAKLKESKTLEELLAAQAPKKEEQPTPAPVPEVKGLTEEDVLAVLARKSQQEVATANVNKAEAALKEAYGAEWEEVSGQKLVELGLTPELANTMAETAPEAFLKLMGAESKAKPSLQSNFTPEKKVVERPKFNPFKPSKGSDLELWDSIGNELKQKHGN